MALTCLDTLVGLSPVDVSCFTDDAPTGYATSDAGYYLTDADFGVPALVGHALAGWTILQDSREQAIREFQDDLLAAIRTRYASAVTPFSGYIGDLKATATRVATNDFIGHRIRARRQKGVKVRLTAIRVGLSAVKTLSITVKSNNPLFTSPAALALTTVANQFTAASWPDSGVSLPLWADNDTGDYIEYYIGFDRQGASPLNNKFWCCNNTPAWRKHIDVSGFDASSAAPETSGSFSSSAMGVSLNCYLECETLDWLCELTALNGYDVRSVAARCIQQRGAAIAAAKMLETPEIGIGGAFNAQVYSDRRNFLNARYANNVKWLSENIPPGVTDCFTCKPEYQAYKSQILV